MYERCTTTTATTDTIMAPSMSTDDDDDTISCLSDVIATVSVTHEDNNIVMVPRTQSVLREGDDERQRERERRERERDRTSKRIKRHSNSRAAKIVLPADLLINAGRPTTHENDCDASIASFVSPVSFYSRAVY